MDPNRHLWQIRWVRDLAILVALVLLLVLIVQFRALVVPVMLGLGLAYAFNPVARWSKRRLNLPRWGTTLGALAGGGVFMLALLVIIVPPLLDQAGALARSLPSYAQQAARWFDVDFEKLKPALDEMLRRDEQDQTDNAQGAPDGQGQDQRTGAPDGQGQDQRTGAPDGQTDGRPDGQGGSSGTSGGPGPGGDATEPEVQPDGDGQATADAQDTPAWPDFSAQADRASTSGADDDDALADTVAQADVQQVARVFTRALGLGLGAIGSAISLATYLALSAVLLGFSFFYFSWKFEHILAWCDSFIPPRHRDKAMAVIGRMDRALSSFIRGRLIQATVMASILSVGWLIAGVPYWLLLGVLSGLLNLIPYTAVVGCVAAVGLTALDQVTAQGAPPDIWALAWPLLVYALAQTIDGWLVEPIFQGRATELDPLTVLLSVVFGGALAGLLGLILAIPIAACVKILCQDVILPRLRHFVQELE